MSSRASLPGLLVVVLAAGGLLSGAPAVGDWLVTTGGSAVETRGSWEIKGRLVVFHTADGTFASVRLNEVDLGASIARTEAAVQAALEMREAESTPLGSTYVGVRQALGSWSSAWSAQDLDSYLAAYSRDFRPDGSSRASWEALRRERLTAPEFIEVSTFRLELARLSDNLVEATFFQTYRSNLFSDSVTKVVELALEDGAWKILSESTSAKPGRRPGSRVSAGKAKFVLTDADVGHVDPATIRNRAAARDEREVDSSIQPATGEGAGGEVMASEDSPLEVISWDAVLGAGSDGVRVRGVVRNPSEFFAGDISLSVTLLDLEGGELETRIASMEANALAPGEQGEFEVSFPGVFTVGNALFEVTSFNAVISR